MKVNNNFSNFKNCNINNYEMNYNNKDEKKNKAFYKIEPFWRSEITLAILTWIGTIIGIITIFF